MARAVANSGGVVGIDFYPGHLRLGGRESGPGQGSWDTRGAKPTHAGPPGLDDLAAHVALAVQVCGEDHVVFGGDFDGFRDPLDGLAGVRDVPRIASALRRAGLSSRQTEKVYGENLIRFLIDAW
jgi:membrane dipeptidase